MSHENKKPEEDPSSHKEGEDVPDLFRKAAGDVSNKNLEEFKKALDRNAPPEELKRLSEKLIKSLRDYHSSSGGLDISKKLRKPTEEEKRRFQNPPNKPKNRRD